MDRKQAEAGIDSRFSHLNDLPLLIRHQSDDGECRFCNRSWLEYTGGTAETECGDGWLCRVHPDDRERCREVLLATIRRRAPFELEYRLRRKDGEYRWLLETGGPVPAGGGDDAGYLCCSYDITGRVKAERVLLQSEMRLRETLENIRLIAIRLDTAGQINLCNKYFLELVDYPIDAVIGRNWFEVFVPPDQATVREMFYSSIKAGKMPVQVQNDILTRAGERRFISWTNVMVHDDDGAISGVMSIGEDITERNKAYNTLAMYQEKLRGLAAELSLAEERERRRLAAELHDQIGQSLTFAKIKADSLKNLVREEGAAALGDVTTLIDRAIQDTRSLIYQISSPILYELGLEASLEWLAEHFETEHGLRIAFYDDGAGKPLSDEVKVTLFQVVRELLINVAKHARADRVSLAVRRRRNQIVISVADDGDGFELSQVVGDVRGRRGFGLFNIRQRLELLGGELDIASLPGRGTTATVVAPLDSDPGR